MSGKYDNIPLGRMFRPHVLGKLKALPGWNDWLRQNGWLGRSETMTTPDVRAACEALAFDLEAEWTAFDGAPATTRAKMAMTAAKADDDDNMKGDNTMTTTNEGAGADSADYEGKSPEALIGEILAPAGAHITPYLAQMLPALIKPVVEAAVRGPRVVTQTVTQTVTVDSDGAVVTPVAPVAPHAALSAKTALGVAFGVGKNAVPGACKATMEGLKVAVCDAVDAPAVDPDYVWNVPALCDIAAQDVQGLNAWIFGPAGTGKTEGMRQYAARLRRPFVRIAIERTTEPAELIGQEMPAKGGGMKWVDGKLTRAFRLPYCVILIDEPTLLRSGTLAVLQTALDMRELYLSTGETVKAAPGVFIVAADNTAGCGDDTGRYVDTAPVNAAFLDRFALRTAFDFLPTAQEASMLAARTGVHANVARIMVDYAGLTRKNADAGKLTMAVTTRRLLAWARIVRTGVPSLRAFQGAVIAAAAPEDKEILLALATTSLTSQHAHIDGVVRGEIDPDAPVVDPKAQGPIGPAALQFPDDDATA
jgi:cobaltochelatase CobS